MINGVKVTQLAQIHDERGKIMHFLRSSDPDFEQFGEVYFSMIYPGVVKAWHRHRVMTLNYVVPVGRIKFVLYDAREESSTFGAVQELYLGPDCYQRVTVPPGIWNGFKGIGVEPALVANCATHVHDPAEIDRRPPDDETFPYSWELVHR